MIKYLQSKKGFTIIELIVVVAIIAVLMAIVLPLISNENAKKREACDTARDFYSAVQYIFTRYSLYEAPLSVAYDANLPGGDEKLGVLRYYRDFAGNYPYDPQTLNPDADNAPETTSIWIEIQVKNGNIANTNVHVVAQSRTTYYTEGIWALYQKRNNDGYDAYPNTEFERLLAAELDKRIVYRDGFYYAKVTFNETASASSKMELDPVKVDYAAYIKKGLPEHSSFVDLYMDCLFVDDYKLASGDICGTCAGWNETKESFIGQTGTRIS